jgi:hypothetical protein
VWPQGSSASSDLSRAYVLLMAVLGSLLVRFERLPRFLDRSARSAAVIA